MHELAVTESLLEIAVRHARAQNARRITDLYLVIGQWSSIVDDWSNSIGTSSAKAPLPGVPPSIFSVSR